MAGTETTNPHAAAATARLRNWAVTGPGRELFKWGTPGDYDRCCTFYKGKMPEHMIHGWCATLHKLATGAAPGHAPGEAGAKKAATPQKKAGKGY